MLFLNLSVPNDSTEYQFKECFLLSFPGCPLRDTELEIPKSLEHSLVGMLDYH